MFEEKIIRKVAKKVENINLFAAAKELHNINLFKNTLDFSKIQKLYLSYLYFYSDLYSDLVIKKINEIILTDNLYEDAYMLWKKENPDNYLGKKKTEEKGKDLKLVFSNPNKEVNNA